LSNIQAQMYAKFCYKPRQTNVTKQKHYEKSKRALKKRQTALNLALKSILESLMQISYANILFSSIILCILSSVIIG
jgi:hypothetical protein